MNVHALLRSQLTARPALVHVKKERIVSHHINSVTDYAAVFVTDRECVRKGKSSAMPTAGVSVGGKPTVVHLGFLMMTPANVSVLIHLPVRRHRSSTETPVNVSAAIDPQTALKVKSLTMKHVHVSVLV